MKFLNGWKTILGIVGTVTTLGIANGGRVGEIAGTVQQVAGHLDSVALGVFGALTAIGVIHRTEKRKGK